ncbi:PAS domain S-box protein (macronuclear) [Tetrahymena thermophila SB210]|uniref:PAS domain S-box protein n=1 Tax=Tetrahymena thermophila (strain SB210) TaxID=312017 RepID=I7MJY3_TETTS|nr:PAS domain S-box protein [Tetrahymena thermophila SB210]EAR97308.2 PAS domain S-box protein [Tetrahymena thermophila SB210]|eukprot:XP_001017553.2 PAS domain S-box protein [Tetrahymena thermophila SB210]
MQIFLCINQQFNKTQSFYFYSQLSIIFEQKQIIFILNYRQFLSKNRLFLLLYQHSKNSTFKIFLNLIDLKMLFLSKSRGIFSQKYAFIILILQIHRYAFLNGVFPLMIFKFFALCYKFTQIFYFQKLNDLLLLFQRQLITFEKTKQISIFRNTILKESSKQQNINQQKINTQKLNFPLFKMNLLLKIRNQIQDYYQKQIIFVVKMNGRPVFFGHILLFIRFFFHIQLMLSQNLMNEIISFDANLNEIGDYSIFFDKSYSQVILYIGIVITALVFIALFNDFIFCQFHLLQLTSSFSRRYLGMIFQIFNHILYIPLLYFGIDQAYQNNLAAIYGIISTIIIGIFVSIHDQDYSIQSIDSLANRLSPKIMLLNIIIESCVCISLRYISKPKIMLLISILLSVFKILISVSTRSYENRKIRTFHQFLSIYHFLLTLFLYISILQYSNIPITLIMILIIPISLKIAYLIDKYQHNLTRYSFKKQLLLLDPTDIDFYLRVLMKVLKLEYKDYCENSQSIILEYITQHHNIYCEDYPDCFCNKEPKDIRQYEDMRLEKQLRLKYINKYVRQMYNKCIQEGIVKTKKINNLIAFSYLNFLIEISQSKVLCFSEIIKLKMLMNLSEREVALFNFIFQKAVNKFTQIDISSTLVYKKKQNQKENWKYFEEQKLNEDQAEKKGATFDEKISVTNYIIGINFDELVNQAEEQYYATIQEKQSLLQLLFQDHIDLEVLKLKAQNLIHSRKQLLKKFLMLHKINQNSQKLQFYIENFVNTLGFGQKKRQIFKKDRQFTLEGLKTDVNIFSKDTCVVFITLVNEVGTIRKVQNKFENIFGYSSSKSIKSNINIIIPKYIQKVHDKVLSNYLQNPENFQINNFKLQIAQSEGGWAVPISLKFRPDYINLEDCGLTAFIQKVQNEYSYILLSCGYFKIQCLSQILFTKIFGKLYSQNEVYKIYLNRVIPLLNYFEKQQVKQIDLDLINEAVQTVAFLPKLEIIQKGFKRFHLYEKLDLADLQKYVENLTIEYYDLYSVKLKFYYNNYKKIQFNVVELHKFKKITSYQAQKEGLITFKNQLKTLMNIDLNIKSDLDIIDQFMELQTLQFYQKSVQQFSISEEEDESQADELKEKQQEHQFFQGSNESNQVISLPLQAHREDIQKDLFTNEEDFSKLGYHPDSNLQGINQQPYFKYDEHLQEVENKNAQDSTNIYDQQQDLKIDNLSSFNNINQTNNQVLLSPLSNNPLQTTFYNPLSLQSENRLISPKQAQDKFSFQKNIIPQKQEIFVEQKTNQEQTSVIKQIATEQYISQESIGNNNNNINSNNNNITQKQQQLRQMSFEHQASVTSILNEYYDIKQKEVIGDKAQSKNKILNNLISYNKKDQTQMQQITDDKSSNQIKEEDEDEQELDKSTQDQKSILQKNSSISSAKQNGNSTNNFNLCQMLKERIRQAKMQIEQQNQTIFTRKSSKQQTQIQSNAILSSQRLSVLIGQGRESVFDDSNGAMSSNLIGTRTRMNQLSLEKYYSSHQLEKTKTKKISKPKSQHSHKQVLNANDLTSEQLSDSIAKQEEIQRELEMQRSRVLGASSVNTNQSQNQEQKKSIFKMVNSEKKNYSLFILLVFSFIALSSFSTLILYQYFQNSSQFDTALLNFNYLPWPLSVRFLYSKVLADQVIKEMFWSQYFQSFQSQPQYEQVVQARQKKIFYLYKQSYLDFVNADNVNQNYFTYITTTQIPVLISKDPLILEKPYLNITSQKLQATFPVLYFMAFMQGNLYRMTIDQDQIYTQTVQLDNFSVFNTQVTKLQTLLSLSVTDITNTIRNQALLIMILVIIVICILGLAIIPLYYHVQIKNEELLKLFATISSQSLNDMIQPIQISIMSHKTQTKIKYFQLPIYKKRRAISSCSEIPKINIKYIIYIIIGIFLMAIQPVISFLYVNSFYNEANVLISLIQNFYTTKAYCTSLQAISNSMILIKSQKYQIYNTVYYTGRIQSLISQQTDNINSFYQAIQQSQSSIRFENDQYNNFFYPLITDNICDTIQNNPQYVKSQNQFDISTCKSIKSGILTKGLQISLKNLFETYAFIGPMYNITDYQSYTQSFYSWEDSNNLVELDQFFDIITTSMEILKDFLLERVNSFLNQMKSVLKSLLIYQLIMMIIIFYFGFIKFYEQVKLEMIQTKRMLSILSIEVILDNPYILSYLSKQES